MANIDYKKETLKALNLVETNPESEALQLQLGKFKAIDTEPVSNTLIDLRRIECLTTISKLKSDFGGYQSQAIIDKIPPSYNDYLELIKTLPKIKKDLAELKALNSIANNDKIYSTLSVFDNLNPEIGHIKELDKQNWLKTQIETYNKTMRKGHLFNYLYDDRTLKIADSFEIYMFTNDQKGYEEFLKKFFRGFYYKVLNVAHEANLKEEDRKRHSYIVGGTGSGKSELIKLLIHGYMSKPDYGAMVVIDPHGDLVEEIAHWKEFAGNDKLVYVEPYLHKNHAPTLNPLDSTGTTSEEREVIAQQIVGVFEQLLKGSAGASLSVNMRTLLLPCLLVLLDKGNSTMADLQTFLNDDHNDTLIALGKKSPRKAIARFFDREFSDKHFSITKQSVRTKLQSLFNSGVFYEMVNGTSSIDLKQAVEQRKIILFNLAKGNIGGEASEALGRLIIANLQGLALRRQNLPPEKRTPIHLFVDECQNYIGESTINILEEARKYKLYLTLAQQVAGRGMSPEMRTVVLNNTNVKMAGRTAEDPRIAKLMGLELTDVQNLDVGQFYCRTGNSPTFLLRASTKVLQNSNAMAADEWEKVKAKQKAHFRSIKALPDDMTSDIELE